MDGRFRELIPHVIAMITLYGFFLVIAAAVFGYDDFWAALTIGVAILFGYKPIVVALGIAPDRWVDDIKRRDN